MPDLSRLIGMIYDGPYEQPLWSSALRIVRQDLRAAWVALILRPATPQQPALMFAAGLGTAWLVRESTYVHYDEFTLDRFVNLPSDRVVSIDQFLGTAAWLKSDLYRRLSKPRGLRYALGADIAVDDDVCARLRIVRSEGQGPFSADDHAYCDALLPHLRRAIRSYTGLQALEAERELLDTVSRDLGVGVIMLDGDGTVLRTNASAEVILAQRAGLRATNGTLACDSAEETRRLRQAIRAASQRAVCGGAGVSTALPLGRRDGRPRLSVLVRSAAACGLGGRSPAVLLLVRDAERGQHLSQPIIARLLNLTPMEAALACELANGAALNDAACTLGIRHNTARAHLRSIFGKTGVSRQTDLVRIILNSVAIMGNRSESEA
jgi:DNA-binding CsgD family transcriptional regulator